MRGVFLGLIVLVPSLVAGQDAGRTAREQYEALVEQFKAASDAWDKQFGSAGQRNSPEAPKEARYRDWPGWTFAPRFVELAERHPGDPAAMDALLKVADEIGRAVGQGDIALVPHFHRALEIALRDHLESERMREFCRAAARYVSPSAEPFLRSVLEKSRNRNVRGAACLNLARYLNTKGEVAEKPWFDDKEQINDPFVRFVLSRYDPDSIRYIRESKPRESYSEAVKHFKRAEKEYGDVIVWQAPNDPARHRLAGEVARASLTELRARLGQRDPEQGEPGARSRPH